MAEKVEIIRSLILIPLLAFMSLPAHAEEAKRPFTVADDIGLTWFSDPCCNLKFSPDGAYFAVWSERGLLDRNVVENSLRLYRSRDAQSFLEHPDDATSPAPLWVVSRSAKTGDAAIDINGWSWLANSSGVAFLDRSGKSQQLFLADLQSKTIEPLTGTNEHVHKFDIVDRRHYVYTATELADDDKELQRRKAERDAPSVVLTGRGIWEVIRPEDDPGSSSYVWAVIGAKRFKVQNNGTPLTPDELAVSPDGRFLVTTVPVPNVPSSWETLYPPPYPSAPLNRIHAGAQDVRQYALLDLRTGSSRALTETPVGDDAGWYWAGARPKWSSDGRAVLLTNVFLKKNGPASRPCVAVIDLSTDSQSCVEALKGRTETTKEAGYHTITGAEFIQGDERRVLVSFRNSDISFGANEYRQDGGSWQAIKQYQGNIAVGPRGLEVAIHQGLNDPPTLVASKGPVSRVIWESNQQLKDTDLVHVDVYKWKDENGRDWTGGLYKPANYELGKRYPLVIQGHGFASGFFIPAGSYPTGFAAQELASAGMLVLQVPDTNCVPVSQDANEAEKEADCALAAYESAAKQLVSEGLIEPDKIGIIGFSRNCYYVMHAITTSRLHPAAASITDGVTMDYLSYVLYGGGFGAYERANGGKPIGEGLQQWLKRSPSFNLEKVTTPLMVVGEGPQSTLSMWQTYSILHYLHKPVDLIMLNTREHVLSNPAMRMASQQGSVDWFRFWLQGYEDPDPAKAEQYKRWRELRKMQSESDKRSSIVPSLSN